jgi:hypothetical protein
MVEMQLTLDKLQGLQDRVDLGKDKASSSKESSLRW